MPLFMRKLTIFTVVLVLILEITGLGVAHAATLIGTQDEIEMGQNIAKQLEKKYGLVEDAELQDRVTKIGMNMVAVCDRPKLPYTFKVLNSKEVNALAVPGGFIYIFKGLVDYMPSDEELAGVIGHELGHIVKRHSVKQIEKNLGVSVLFGLVFGDKGVYLQNLAVSAIMAGYSRDDEREADKLGFIHSYRAGYNPYSMMLGLQKLSELNQKYHADLFSSHPEGRERVKRVQGYIDSYKIRPQVAQTDDGKGAQVVDGDWRLPQIYAAYNGYKPLYRAYFAAGELYKVSRLPDYDGNKYILDSDGTNIIIYYDDHIILTLTPEDAAVSGMDIMDLAGSYIGKLKSWHVQERQ